MIPKLFCEKCAKQRVVFCHHCGIENPTQRHTNRCVMKNLTKHTNNFCVRCRTKVNSNLMCDICYCNAIGHIQNICNVPENHPECYVEIKN